MKLKLSAPMRADIDKRMVRVGVYLTSKIRQYLNVSQRYRRTLQGGHVGLAPSLPGHFPKKLSGQLQKSITWEFNKPKMQLTVGSNLKGYPAFLNLGTKTMAARPWLTLAWSLEKDNATKLLVK